MSKEQQELLDVVYKKYQTEMMFHPEDNWLEELDGMCLGTGEMKKVYRQYAPVEFINKCKTDTEFSKKWGLKIEERELSEDERYELCAAQKSKMTAISEEDYIKYNIPTKLITITYNDKTIESYDLVI
jgi:hypothetical protein